MFVNFVSSILNSKKKKTFFFFSFFFGGGFFSPDFVANLSDFFIKKSKSKS